MHKKASRIPRFISIFLVFCMLTAILPANVAISAKGAATSAVACTEYSGNNINAQDYISWADTVKSYLTVCKDGSLMRFQYVDGGQGYIAEYFDASTYQLLRTKEIAAELPIFGAFYESESNYFILTGQENKEQSAKVECFRITKYDKNWKRIKSVGVYDCNTTQPFRYGSARVTQQGNSLFIRTCHEMYAVNGGKNPQANGIIQVDLKKMKITKTYMTSGSHSQGRVSISFNQFVQNDNGKIVAVEHGNAYPREVTLIECGKNASSTPKYRTVLEIPGEVGDTYTGVSVGGFEYSDTSYLVAGNKVDFGSGDDKTRNIFVAAMPKAKGKAEVVQITDYTAGEELPSTPHLVKTGANAFILLWGKGDFVYYTQVDGEGKQTGKIYGFEASLSDCVPLVLDKKIVWYTWKDGTVVFYEIERSDLSKNKKTTVQTGHDYSFKSVKNSIITLKCTKCGKETKKDVPEDFKVWWQEQDRTDGKYSSIYHNPLDVGESIELRVAPEWEETKSTREKSVEFLVECSDRKAVKITSEAIPDGTGWRATILLQKTGEYTVTIRHMYDDSLSKEFSFEVIDRTEGVSFSKKQITLSVGEKYTLKPVLTPKDASTVYTWTSSNQKVATVDETGKVTAVGKGTAKITVKTANGKNAVCKVTVK